MRKTIGYKTINLINGNFYYGVHLLNPKYKDNYLGSGVALNDAIKKYGRFNFKRIEIEVFNKYEDALQWESKIITEELIKSNSCYNINIGGSGGSLKWDKEKKERLREKGSYKKSELTKVKLAIIAKIRFKTELNPFKGKKHTDEQKTAWSKSRSGKLGLNKGKKLNLSKERREELRKPKSKEVIEKIRKSLRKLTDEQVNYLENDFVHKRGEKARLAKEWSCSIDSITLIVGKSFVHKNK